MSNEFSFTWEGADAPGGPWAHLLVARFDAREAISELYRYDLTLLAQAPAPEVDPDELVGRRATLRLMTQSTPAFKVVHGIVAEAHELAHGPAGLFYHVRLVPPWERARHRRRSRIFVDKTLRQIVETVLTMDPRMTLLPHGTVEDDDGALGYAPAAEQFTWRVTHGQRLDDRRVRAYCVQYRESDQDFVARLLEEEGLGYHFENGDGRCLLVISDLDAGKTRVDEPIGPGIDGRHLSQLQLGARMRPGKVTLDDYNWKKPRASMVAQAEIPGPAADLGEYVYPGGYPDSAAQGQPLSEARVDRYAVEADYAALEGNLRVLSAGALARVIHGKARYEGRYLVTALHARGEQSGVSQVHAEKSLGVPYQVELECARCGRGAHEAESRFRPARTTPKPRILGSQTAVVTAEPSATGAEVNVGGPDGLSVGCVRLRFHWDRDSQRHAKEPTSCWVRVSQAFAGGGQGAVWHPRVGVEVIVGLEDGDPDRPLVVGRVYNGQNVPHHHGSPVHSTFKSFSTPGAGTWNEVTIDDTAGSELVFVNAGKDQTTNVNNDRLEQIGSDATMTVGVDNVEIIGVDCTTTVGANDSMTIGANDTKTIGANRTRTVGANHTKVVGANETHTIVGSEAIEVAGTLTELTGGAVTETYASTRTTTVGGAVEETFAATREVSVSGLVLQDYGAPQTVDVEGARRITVNGFLGVLVSGKVENTYNASLGTHVGAVLLTVAGGGVKNVTPSHKVNAPLKLHLTGVDASAHALSTAQLGTSIGLTGVKHATTGCSISSAGTGIFVQLTREEEMASKIEITGMKLRVGAARFSTIGEMTFL